MSSNKHKNPVPTVDGIINNKKNQILFIKRKNDPFKNHLSLPGGFINYGETAEDAIKREIAEETSLNVEPLEILGVYSDPNRDPRGHIMTAVFICLNLEDIVEGKAGDDAENLFWIDLDKINDQELAFDHKLIIQDYQKWRTDSSTFWSTKTR